MPASSAPNITFNTSPVWSSTFAPSESVLSVAPATAAPIASYGRVIGNKGTLYKYLNPHLSVVTTLTAANKQAHVYVVDTTTGSRVFSAEVENVDEKHGVKAAMVENWLVYAWLESTDAGVDQWRIASVELYEETKGSKIQRWVIRFRLDALMGPHLECADLEQCGPVYVF
jgi:hypothetical protein